VLFPLGGRAAISTFKTAPSSSNIVPNSKQVDRLGAWEQIGTRRCYEGGEEIYSDGDAADSSYRVVSGTVRICKLLTDGRRHISKFCFAGDCFGWSAVAAHAASAEAVDHVVVMRYPQRAVKCLIEGEPRLLRDLYDRTLHELGAVQHRMMLLGRMTAAERVASFLIEISDRRHTYNAVDLPMTRTDIADYLGLTIETVCRELSKFRRDGIIASTKPRTDRILLRDRAALEAICDSDAHDHWVGAAAA